MRWINEDYRDQENQGKGNSLISFTVFRWGHQVNNRDVPEKQSFVSVRALWRDKILPEQVEIRFLWTIQCGMNLGPKRMSGESSSSKYILYSKLNSFPFGFRDSWAPTLRLLQGSIWSLHSHFPCSPSLLIFFFAFLFHFPITISPCLLTSLLTLTEVEKNWKTIRQQHYLESYPTAAGSTLKLPLDIKHLRHTSMGTPTTDVPFFTPPRSGKLPTKSATPRILNKHLIVLVVHQVSHTSILSSLLIAFPIPQKWQ